MAIPKQISDEAMMPVRRRSLHKRYCLLKQSRWQMNDQAARWFWNSPRRLAYPCDWAVTESPVMTFCRSEESGSFPCKISGRDGLQLQERMRMASSPETRPSLMLRLRSARDEAAWAEFLVVYEPLVLRLLRKQGLQDSDARDVWQQVLAAVVRDIEQWKPDGAAASFRRWLFRITRNRVARFLGRPKLGTIAAGGSDAQELLAAQPDLHEPFGDDVERDYRQHLLLCATVQVRPEFRESTWQAFWQTCIEGRPVGDVATELGMSVGNVYVARSRIMAQLRARVAEMQAEE